MNIKNKADYFDHLEIHQHYAQQYPNNCAVIERTVDGKSVGACCFALHDGVCFRHGLVKKVKEKMEEKLNQLISELPFYDELTKGDYQEIEDPIVQHMTDKAVLINGQWLPKSCLRTDGELLYCTIQMYAQKF